MRRAPPQGHHLDSEAARSPTGWIVLAADFVYMSVPAHPRYHTSVLPPVFDEGRATVDTGCQQRMAIGWGALIKHQQHLPNDLPIHFFPEKHQFRSAHQTSVTERIAVLPSSLGVRGSFLNPAVWRVIARVPLFYQSALFATLRCSTGVG